MLPVSPRSTWVWDSTLPVIVRLHISWFPDDLFMEMRLSLGRPPTVLGRWLAEANAQGISLQSVEIDKLCDIRNKTDVRRRAKIPSDPQPSIGALSLTRWEINNWHWRWSVNVHFSIPDGRQPWCGEMSLLRVTTVSCIAHIYHSMALPSWITY